MLTDKLNNHINANYVLNSI